MPANPGDKLPFLQLYVADLIRDCDHLSLAAFGAWVKILCRMHGAQNRGTLRFTTIQLARMLNTTVDQAAVVLTELLDPNNPSGAPVADHDELENEVYELRSRRMIRDERKRKINQRNGAKGGNPKLSGKTESEVKSDNRLSNPPVNPPVKPILHSQSQSQKTREESLVPSSAKPTARPPPDVKPDPLLIDLTIPPSEEPEAQPRKGDRKMTPEQFAVWKSFIDWWCLEAYPSAMAGVEYPFKAEGSRNGKAVSILLKAVNYDLAYAKRVALQFLKAPDAFISKQGRLLYGMTERITTWISAANSPRPFTNGSHFGKPRLTAQQRGENPQPPGDDDVKDL